MQTVLGILADRDGIAWTKVLEPGPDGPRLRTKAWSTRSADVRREQLDHIAIDLNHDGIERGHVVYLERDAHGRLWCIGHVSDDVIPEVRVRVADRTVAVKHDLYWSPVRVGGPDLGIEFLSVALTASPARIGARPVTFLPGELNFRQVADERWHIRRGYEHDLLERAAASYLDRREHGGPMIVRDEHEQTRSLDGLHPTELFAQAEDEFWENRPLRWRPGYILSVH